MFPTPAGSRCLCGNNNLLKKSKIEKALAF
jgi:hypothetical protein